MRYCIFRESRFEQYKYYNDIFDFLHNVNDLKNKNNDLKKVSNNIRLFLQDGENADIDGFNL